MKKVLCLGFACAAVPLVLTGCSTTPDCLEPQPYAHAQQFPPLDSPPGLDVPEPDSSMAIPPVASGPVGTYDAPPESTSDESFARCLIAPPPMPDTRA